MANQFDMHRLLQALADRPSQQMQPRVFTRSEGGDIISCFDKFERIARNREWIKEKQVRSIPLYLDELALIFYKNLLPTKRDNQELVKEALRRQYRNEDRQWRLRSELYTLTQTGTLTQYIDQLEILCHD